MKIPTPPHPPHTTQRTEESRGRLAKVLSSDNFPGGVTTPQMGGSKRGMLSIVPRKDFLDRAPSVGWGHHFQSSLLGRKRIWVRLGSKKLDCDRNSLDYRQLLGGAKKKAGPSHNSLPLPFAYSLRKEGVDLVKNPGNRKLPA